MKIKLKHYLAISSIDTSKDRIRIVYANDRLGTFYISDFLTNSADSVLESNGDYFIRFVFINICEEPHTLEVTFELEKERN